MMNPLSLVVTCIAGWMNRHQQEVIEYLQEEVRVLQEQLGRRPRFNDEQRRRLALKAKTVGRKGLKRFARIVHQHDEDIRSRRARLARRAPCCERKPSQAADGGD